MSSAASPAPTTDASSGRPPEIEDWTNRRFIHPLSRALVTLLIPTGISPNMVSVLGVVMATAAGVSYALVPAPWSVWALAGFAFHIGWHVFDGADGDLARRTGRSSTMGELVDGVCDYLSHVALYVALAVLLAQQIGGLAWPIAVLAGASQVLQANSYESGRRNYWRWVYGVRWIKQELDAEPPGHGGAGRRLMTGLGRWYLSVSAKVTPDERPVEAAMTRLLGGETPRADAARALYRDYKQATVKVSSLLGENHKTIALFASMLLGSPLYYFTYVLVFLNIALVVAIRSQTRVNTRLVERLAEL